jgi:hypothetical protein
VVALTILTACGRIGFPQRADAGVDAGITPDAPVPANLVFVTSSSAMGGFGGTAAADTQCANRAASRGLPGTYVAWLATSTSKASARLGSARGWKRVDGAPVADTVAGLVGGETFNPIDLDETGAQIADNYAFTGTKIDASGDSLDQACNDWTTPSTGAFATVGYLFAGSPDVLSGALNTCDLTAHFYCFAVDYMTPMRPSGNVTGRIAFVSKSVTLGASGAMAFDSRCQAEATAAGLPGSYLAAVATTTQTIASRFTTDARPWQRVDGTTITSDGASLFAAAGVIPSFVNQTADGTYTASTAPKFIWTGATPNVTGTAASTCSNWTLQSGNGTVGYPNAAELGSFWATPTPHACTASHSVLCLEQ